MTHSDTLGINVVEAVTLTLADLTKVFSDIARFGFKHVRVEIPWILVQPTKKTWNWAQVYDVRNIAAANGLTLLPILGVHNPTWAWTPEDYGTFCYEAAKVLGAPAYELGNEPNLNSFNKMGTADAIVPLIKAGDKGIGKADMGAMVIFPGLAAAVTAKGFNLFPWLGPFGWWQNTSPEDFVARAFKLGLTAVDFDKMGYHPYSLQPSFAPEPPNPKQPMILRQDALAAQTKRKLWATEWGFDLLKVTPTVAAQQFLVQLKLITAERSYLFDWRPYPGKGGDFGLVDARNVPRDPYYSTVKAALNS